jgi:hypothetical protein
MSARTTGRCGLAAADIERRTAQLADYELMHVLLWLPRVPSLRVTVVIRLDRRRFSGFVSHHQCATMLRNRLQSVKEAMQRRQRASEASFVRTPARVAQ